MSPTASPLTPPSGRFGDDLVIGVDGGGTKTSAWLARRSSSREDAPLGCGEAGPGNPRSAGFDVAQASIAAAIAGAFHAAGLAPAPVAAACFGLSGAGRPEEQQAITDWALRAGLARQVRVTHDAEIILAAGATQPAGVALICGTGSFAWGRNAAGETERCGGWGYLLGDEGSGYAIALAGLRAAARAADGRGPPTLLLERLQSAVQATQPSDLIHRIYQPGVTRDWIAGLAAIVCDAAEHDPVAAGIEQEAASELTLLVVTLARRLSLAPRRYDLALAGGVIAHQPRLLSHLEQRLSNSGNTPNQIQLVTEPVRGAVALARQVK